MAEQPKAGGKKRILRKKQGTSISTVPKTEPKTTKSPALPDSSVMDEAVSVIRSFDPVAQEDEQFQEYLRLFKRLRKMAHTMERKFDDSPSSQNVYAILKIYDEVREVIADLRAMRDIQQMGNTLNLEVLTPFCQQTAAALASIQQNLKSEVKGCVPPECIAAVMSLVNQQVGLAATEINGAYKRSLVRTVEVFGGV